MLINKTNINSNIVGFPLSNQFRYDFGLRALKPVLVSAANVKRDRIQRIKEELLSSGETFIDEGSIAENLPEQEILIHTVAVRVLIFRTDGGSAYCLPVVLELLDVLNF